MAQWAKQWIYLSNFLGEGSKPEQLYILIIFLYFICIKIYIYTFVLTKIFSI